LPFTWACFGLLLIKLTRVLSSSRPINLVHQLCRFLTEEKILLSLEYKNPVFLYLFTEVSYKISLCHVGALI
jgi:hypothetical protein